MTAPYYDDDAVTIYLGDCREIMPALMLALTDVPTVAITDPPYGETSLAWDRWPTGWIDGLPSSVVQLWCFGSMRMFLEQRDQFVGWRYAQEIVWEKNNGSGFQADRFRRVHEFVTHWYRGAWADLTRNVQTVERPHDLDKSRTGARSAPHMNGTGAIGYVDDGTRLVRTIIAVAPPRDALHPTQKPLGILEPLVQYSTNPGDVILDPMMGVGSTLIAAKANGRRAIGIEADEHYCEIAARRLSETLALGAAS